MKKFKELVEAAEKANPGFKERVAKKAAELKQDEFTTGLEEVALWLEELTWQVNYLVIMSVVDEIWEILDQETLDKRLEGE